MESMLVGQSSRDMLCAMTTSNQRIPTDLGSKGGSSWAMCEALYTSSRACNDATCKVTICCAKEPNNIWIFGCDVVELQGVRNDIEQPHQ